MLLILLFSSSSQIKYCVRCIIRPHLIPIYVCMEGTDTIFSCPWPKGSRLYKLTWLAVTCSLPIFLPGYFSIYFPMLLVFPSSFLPFNFPSSSCAGEQCSCHNYLPTKSLDLILFHEFFTALGRLLQLVLASESPSSHPAALTTLQLSAQFWKAGVWFQGNPSILSHLY